MATIRCPAPYTQSSLPGGTSATVASLACTFTEARLVRPSPLRPGQVLAPPGGTPWTVATCPAPLSGHCRGGLGSWLMRTGGKRGKSDRCAQPNTRLRLRWRWHGKNHCTPSSGTTRGRWHHSTILTCSPGLNGGCPRYGQPAHRKASPNAQLPHADFGFVDSLTVLSVLALSVPPIAWTSARPHEQFLHALRAPVDGHASGTFFTC